MSSKNKATDETKLQRLDKFKNDSEIARETITLLQKMVQHDTTNPPGNELGLAKFLEKIFKKENNPLIKTKVIETVPNRGNLVVTIEGTERDSNPCWGFAAHIDVVPIEDEKNWDHPPFSGELVQLEHDQFIWGRGSFDMKYIGASYIMALLTHLREGFRPKGDIKLIFEADEERGGEEGMKILVDEYWDDIACDCLITEGGGFKLPMGNDFAIQAAEKGKCQLELRANGIPGHGSTPEKSKDLAIYKINAILNKLKKRKPRLYISQEYKNMVNSLSIPGIAKFLLKRKRILRGLITLASKISGEPLDRFLIPMLSDTIVPTIIRSGNKVNVISPHASLSLDIRTLPNHDNEFIYKKLRKIIGKKLYDELEVIPIDQTVSTSTTLNTPYYELIRETLNEMHEGANIVPILMVGGTDMKHTRRKAISYGFSLMMKDKGTSYDELGGMAHSPNERISVSNLMLNTEFIYRIMKKL